MQSEEIGWQVDARMEIGKYGLRFMLTLLAWPILEIAGVFEWAAQVWIFPTVAFWLLIVAIFILSVVGFVLSGVCYIYLTYTLWRLRGGPDAE